jgi:FKBP-type peptidyl-prolyl cis-trans isomerase
METCMQSIAPWLLVAVLLVNLGCRQSESKSSSSASGETQTSTSISGSGPGSGASATGATGSGMSATAKSDAAPVGPVVTTASGLQYQDIVVGTGAEATSGSTVSVHYTGWLTDGTQFDTSRDRGQPIQFQIGTQYIIQGWNEGVAGMKVGGKRKLTIPPSLGYGEGGRPPVIPPNATLKFDIELLAVN